MKRRHTPFSVAQGTLIWSRIEKIESELAGQLSKTRIESGVFNLGANF